MVLLSKPQRAILFTLVGSSTKVIADQNERLFDFIKRAELKDFILIDDIIYQLKTAYLSMSLADFNTDIYINLKKVAFTISYFLFECQDFNESELEILGVPKQSWSELIRFLDEVSRMGIINKDEADRLFTDFFKHFSSSLFDYYYSRKEIISIGSALDLKSFRRALFKRLSEDKAIINNLSSEEIKDLVKAIANLWKSDRLWFSTQSRLNDLRNILVYLQSKDIEGSVVLAENIADDLC